MSARAVASPHDDDTLPRHKFSKILDLNRQQHTTASIVNAHSATPSAKPFKAAYILSSAAAILRLKASSSSNDICTFDAANPTLTPSSSSTTMRPPVSSFRTIKKISKDEGGSVYLCLLRRLDANTDHHAQLMVVKQHALPEAVRKEANIIDFLHHPVQSDDVVGSFILREQVTSIAASSWLCLRPIFGRNLQDFGVLCSDIAGIPSYFCWHIFLDMVEAVEYIHGAGVAHNDICASNIMIDPNHPLNEHHFHEYPNVVLIDFDKASVISREKAKSDVRGLLMVVEEVVTKWSDLASVLDTLELKSKKTDPLARFEREVWTVLKREEEMTVEGLRNEWGEMAEAGRDAGPLDIPSWMQQVIHNELAATDEMNKAARSKEIVIKFSRKISEFGAISAD